MSANLESPAGVTTDGTLARVERRGPVLHITLNRAGKYNVLSEAMIASLRATPERVARLRLFRTTRGGSA